MAVKSFAHTILNFTPEYMCQLFAPISDDDYLEYMTAYITSILIEINKPKNNINLRSLNSLK